MSKKIKGTEAQLYECTCSRCGGSGVDPDESGDGMVCDCCNGTGKEQFYLRPHELVSYSDATLVKTNA